MSENIEKIVNATYSGYNEWFILTENFPFNSIDDFNYKEAFNNMIYNYLSNNYSDNEIGELSINIFDNQMIFNSSSFWIKLSIGIKEDKKKGMI